MKKCPGLVRYMPHHEYYRKQSGKLMELFRTYAPVVDQYSIDEAFLDMSGTYSLYGDPVTFAYRLKDQGYIRIYGQYWNIVEQTVGEDGK